MSTKRNLSGVYFRSKNKDTGEYDNIVFEELSGEEQVKTMQNNTPEWTQNLCLILAKTIVEIGKEFNITVK